MPIYLDHHATTPVDPRVLEAMLPYFTHDFGNPASKSHPFGWRADDAVRHARQQVAALLGAEPRELLFTSGATESDNLAVKGAARALLGKGRHIVTSSFEHKAVLDSCKALEREGFTVTYVSPTAEGLITPSLVEAALRDDTVLVSLMWINNEVGTVQPIAEVGALCRSRGIVFHTDAAQGLSLLPFDVEAMNVDLASVTAHKIYGPKGVGALYVRRRPKVELMPLLDGGGQERGLRSGTLNVPGIVGFGAACEIAHRERDAERSRVEALRTRLWEGLRTRIPEIQQHGSPAPRHPGNLSVAIPGVDAERLLLALQSELALSSGSACTSANLAPSHVLRALGVPNDLARASLRIGLGRTNTAAEVDRAIALLCDQVARQTIERD